MNYKGKLSPTKLASFTNELEKGLFDKKGTDGDGPEASGLAITHKILNSYEGKKLARFGNNFRGERKIDFTPLEEVSIPYKSKGGEVNFVLERGKVYDGNMAVYYRGVDDSVDSKGKYNLKLSNNSFELILKEKSDKPNVYICDVIKLYKTKVKNDNNETEIKILKTEPQKDVLIRLINSVGYKSEENQETQKN